MQVVLLKSEHFQGVTYSVQPDQILLRPLLKTGSESAEFNAFKVSRSEKCLMLFTVVDTINECNKVPEMFRDRVLI